MYAIFCTPELPIQEFTKVQALEIVAQKETAISSAHEQAEPRPSGSGPSLKRIPDIGWLLCCSLLRYFCSLNTRRVHFLHEPRRLDHEFIPETCGTGRGRKARAHRRHRRGKVRLDVPVPGPAHAWASHRWHRRSGCVTRS